MNMRAAIIGLGYQFWLHTRWALLGTIVQIIALSVAVHLASSADAVRAVAVTGSLLPSLFIVPFLILVFVHDGESNSSESTFPRHMLVLPLSNTALALTPILCGIACFSLLLVLFRQLVFVPAGCVAPWLSIGLCLAAMLALLSAVSWTPFWFPFARIIFMVGGLITLVAFVVVTRTLEYSEWISNAGLLAAIAIGFAVAVRGIARARRGDGTISPWAAHRRPSTKQAPRLKPFASAQRAQIWLELRRNGVSTAVFVLTLMVFSIHFLWVPAQRSMTVDTLVFPVPFLSSAAFLIIPVFTLGLAGGNFGKFDPMTPSLTAPAFITARPISDNSLIAAKIKASALTVIVVWAIILANVGISLAFPHPGHSETLAQFLHRELTPYRAFIGTLCIAGLIAISWLSAVKSFVLNLCGRQWIIYTWMLMFVFLIMLLALGGRWVFMHPQSHHALLPAIRIIVCVLIAAKVGTAIPIIRAIRRWQIATDSQLCIWTAVWFLIAAILLAIELSLIPAARHSALPLIAIIILFVPYNRMIAMPLAWHWNRHR